MSTLRSRVFITAMLLTLAALPAAAQIKAFPQAEGFGAISTGGRGGDVYHVTNLNDSGVGSLRYGIDNAPSSGRTIVFDVGGWITINSKLGVDSNKRRITIAGQTAPGGVGVTGKGFSVGGDDIIVRHMRFRPGKSAGSDVDSVNTNADAERVIYDHISAQFSTDGTFDNQATDVTLQNSAVAFGLQTHSTGALLENARRLSFHHNLFAHNNSRNPKHRVFEALDYVGNVIYNWDNRAFFMEGTSDDSFQWKANLDGNYFIAGPNQDNTLPFSGGSTRNYETWWGTNAYDSDEDAQHDGQDYVTHNDPNFSQVSSALTRWSNTPMPVADEVWRAGSPDAAYQRVLSEFGATPWDRDDVDQLLHNQVVARSGFIITRESDLVGLGVGNGGLGTVGGGAAPIDSDQDGMPDQWEMKHGTNPAIANNNADFDQDGYTDLEEYLNDLAAFQAIGPIGFNGIGRFADWARWDRRWQPSRLDVARVQTGAAFVDAVGQQAGTLQVGSSTGGNGRLYVTSGWLELTDDLVVQGAGRVEHWGGELRVLNGGVQVDAGAYHLIGGRLETPSLTKASGAAFQFTGGELSADYVGFDLVNNGGTIDVGGEGIGQTTIDGNLSLTQGQLALDVMPGGISDTLIVNGHVTLGGQIDLSGSVGGAGDSFIIMTADSFSGAFEFASPGYWITESGNNLILHFSGFAPVAVPQPTTLSLLLLAGASLWARRRAATTAVVLAVCLGGASQANAIEVAGQLLTDLRAYQLDGDANSWSNNAAGALGDFFTVGGGDLNVSSGVGGVNRSLYVDGDISQAVRSAATTPSALEGNNTRSIEAWLYANGLGGASTPVGWGDSGNNQMSSFRYTSNSTNGMFSGWFNDAGWGGATLPTGQWVHAAWTYDGQQVRGYLNGVLENTAPLSANLATIDSLVIVGGGRNGSTDAFDGYLADVRIHTGVLTDNQVTDNYQEGVAIPPVLGDYNNDGIVNAIDYAVWRETYATGGLLNPATEEVSPGQTDIADFLYWRERYGATNSGEPPGSTSTPEPAAWLLAAIPLALAGRRRR